MTMTTAVTTTGAAGVAAARAVTCMWGSEAPTLLPSGWHPVHPLTPSPSEPPPTVLGLGVVSGTGGTSVTCILLITLGRSQQDRGVVLRHSGSDVLHLFPYSAVRKGATPFLRTHFDLW